MIQKLGLVLFLVAFGLFVASLGMNEFKLTNEILAKNVKAEQMRAENAKGDYDFIVSRAVTNMPDFVSWIKDKIKKQNKSRVFSSHFDFENQLDLTGIASVE